VVEHAGPRYRTRLSDYMGSIPHQETNVHSLVPVPRLSDPQDLLKGKCALGPFLSILVIECKHKCLIVNLCPWMNKVQITGKGMFLSLSTLVLCTNILV
jgi:hypothetical protein